jgi:hypothetical protein
MDGTLLALSALAHSRVVRDLAPRPHRHALALYLTYMHVYGLANAVQDYWLEHLVQRGTTSLELPSLIVPAASWAWAAIVAAALLIHSAAGRVVERRPPEEGVP